MTVHHRCSSSSRRGAAENWIDRHVVVQHVRGNARRQREAEEVLRRFHASRELRRCSGNSPRPGSNASLGSGIEACTSVASAQRADIQRARTHGIRLDGPGV